jgi:deoxyribonuclease-4
MLLGAHVSIAGGIDKAIERGELIGANCIQTFASSPRTLQFSTYPETTINSYLESKKNSSIQNHVFHAIYLVNLASEKIDYVNISIESLTKYQQLAGILGVMGTILHVGSHKGVGFDQVKNQVGKAIATVIKDSPPTTTLLIENAAGHSGTIGQTLEELVELMELSVKAGANTRQIGFCLDTQHAFASGVDGRSEEKLDEFLNNFDRQIGLSFLKIIHLNDSKVTFDSHKDRHENVGDGFLGNLGLTHWLKHPKLTHLPFILEVPGIEGNGPGKEDMNRLKALMNK